MDFDLKPGRRHSLEKTVGPLDTAKNFSSGLVEIFATPAMIAMMENASYHCVQNQLPKGFGTVGFEVNVRHLKATAVGKKVWCESILKEVIGKKLIFEVRAWDEEGEIGKGRHIRYIIDQNAFMEKLA